MAPFGPLVSSAASAARTPLPRVVSFELSSPSDGKSVSPGQMIQCEIRAFATGEHEGLSMFAIDFRQDPQNPETLDLPPAVAPVSLAGFDWPGGFTNPSKELPGSSGYGGTASGSPGAKDRIQIGGMQNTFGVAGPCLGPRSDVCLGQDVDVDLDIASGPSGALVASLSFQAPSTSGSYTFSIDHPAACVILVARSAPLASTTARAKALVAVPSISFTVQ